MNTHINKSINDNKCMNSSRPPPLMFESENDASDSCGEVCVRGCARVCVRVCVCMCVRGIRK